MITDGLGLVDEVRVGIMVKSNHMFKITYPKIAVLHVMVVNRDNSPSHYTLYFGEIDPAWSDSVEYAQSFFVQSKDAVFEKISKPIPFDYGKINLSQLDHIIKCADFYFSDKISNVNDATGVFEE